MFSTLDKAIAGTIVSALANWLMAHYHVTLPGDIQAALSALIVGAIVWVTPNVEKALSPTPPASGAKP